MCMGNNYCNPTEYALTPQGEALLSDGSIMSIDDAVARFQQEIVYLEGAQANILNGYHLLWQAMAEDPLAYDWDEEFARLYYDYRCTEENLEALKTDLKTLTDSPFWDVPWEE